MSNPCINCGKQRIDGKSWEEKTGTSIIVYTQTICPDKECQKLVDKATADRKEKNDNLAKTRAQAKLEREQLIAAS